MRTLLGLVDRFAGSSPRKRQNEKEKISLYSARKSETHITFEIHTESKIMHVSAAVKLIPTPMEKKTSGEIGGYM